MKRSIIAAVFIISVQFAHPQARSTQVVDASYGELGLFPRITNSGIYAVSSFDVMDDAIYLKDFDAPMLTMIKHGIISHRQTDPELRYDLAVGFSADETGAVIPKGSAGAYTGVTVLKKSFQGGVHQLFADNGGVLTSSSGERISVMAANRYDLTVAFERRKFQKNIILAFPQDLAYADLIGIDRTGNSFLLLERYRSEIPLVVQRYIYTISPSSEVLSILSVPLIKYCTTVKEFQIDSSGALYHMLTTSTGVKIIRWDGLTAAVKDTIMYPEEFLYTEHYNSFLTTAEYSEEHTFFPEVAGDRQYALRLGEEYVQHTYTCTNANLAPANVRAADGDTVRTPSWLIAGTNARVAYKWGGFNTIAQFNDGMKTGKFAGDIHTAGVSSSSVGVDCSGFVSRCWGLTYHSSTADMPNITTQYASWDNLKPGDAIHKVGHVRLFVEKMPNGSLRVVESSGRDWSTSYWSYAPSDLNGVYTPRWYTGMANEFSLQRPELLSAAIKSDSSVQLVWKCDTASVLGYRLYSSVNGIQWNLLLNEAVLRDTFAVTGLRNSSLSYRVSSVLRGIPATESNWSNALSAGNFTNSYRTLVIDGFEKTTGSWRGPENVFVTRYGNALARRGISFESIRNSQLSESRFSASKYFALYWMLGDESTEQETFNAMEQSYCKQYLENGGKLFVTGSEIGWDLVAKGSADDKTFYTSYLKALYRSDDANGSSVKGAIGPLFSKCEFAIGQKFEEDYPDEIDTAGGSALCFRYNNLKGAGICYSGKFGASIISGKIIYLAFSLESTASDSGFMSVIDASMEYFDPLSSVARPKNILAQDFRLMQNYPNPFNPVTTIEYVIPPLVSGQYISLRVYNALGQIVATLVNGEQPEGNYTVKFDGTHYASGVYFTRLQMGNRVELKKMTMIK